ncbi:MAG: TetR/AcrR family transcriptional regulator [Gemmataceae bacterium]|nr:TetR/AcrR family transcriptional regulator [Gemmataceae bacterium]
MTIRSVKPAMLAAMGRPKEITDEQILVTARRCFLEHGAGVSVADIAGQLGTSHTTIFNRFGTKERLMIAALGPPETVPWTATLEAGPDDRPLREQLVEHGQVMSAYFHHLQAGLTVLRAAGITPAKVQRGRKSEPPPVQGFRALTAWLRRAQQQGRLAGCDIDTLAATILGALHGWELTAVVFGHTMAPSVGEHYVERFIDLLWTGIGGSEP